MQAAFPARHIDDTVCRQSWCGLIAEANLNSPDVSGWIVPLFSRAAAQANKYQCEKDTLQGDNYLVIIGGVPKNSFGRNLLQSKLQSRHGFNPKVKRVSFERPWEGGMASTPDLGLWEPARAV